MTSSDIAASHQQEYDAFRSNTPVHGMGLSRCGGQDMSERDLIKRVCHNCVVTSQVNTNIRSQHFQ
ncbi:hypothetical protein SAMN05216299_104160 [Nitrosospira sp. Nsp14]|nr:hypothetical protein SAMN05216299_104160 [Nitrosospira sp. Nsp14]